MFIAEILTHASAALHIQGIPNPRLDAEVLLAYVLGLTRAGFYARLQDDLSEVDTVRFHQLLHRRLQREPLQYITGVQEFWSLEFIVNRDVLIPRSETELVVETALNLLDKRQKAKIRENQPRPGLQFLDPGPWVPSLRNP